MATMLITGANKGLGYETARRLLAEGHLVWVAARDRERGAAAAESLGARFVEMDVALVLWRLLRTRYAEESLCEGRWIDRRPA